MDETLSSFVVKFLQNFVTGESLIVGYQRLVSMLKNLIIKREKFPLFLSYLSFWTKWRILGEKQVNTQDSSVVYPAKRGELPQNDKTLHILGYQIF